MLNLFLLLERFWRDMYCRFENDVHPREPLGDLLLATCDHSSSLEDHIKLLQKVTLQLYQWYSFHGFKTSNSTAIFSETKTVERIL